MSEPARIAELVRLALVAAVAFGWVISDAQAAAVVAVVAYAAYAAASWGITEWVRRRVTPVAAPKLPQGSKVAVTVAGVLSHTDTVR